PNLPYQAQQKQGRDELPGRARYAHHHGWHDAAVLETRSPEDEGKRRRKDQSHLPAGPGRSSRVLTGLRLITTFAYTHMKTKARNPVSRVFRAFSDPTRLRILSMLRGGELCVCHIVEVLRVPQPKASRHLAYLRKCGLVLARKQGQWNYYRLAKARSDLHRK